MFSRLVLAAAMFGLFAAAGCSANGSGTSLPAPSVPTSSAFAGGAASAHRTLTEPALIALDDNTGRLEYWPLREGGSRDAHWLSRPLGISDSTAMVANGDQLYISSEIPSAITTYNVDTKASGTLAVPYGTPQDLAIDKAGTLYALSRSGVAVYPAASAQPYQLTCSDMEYPSSIAVDNESDVFVNGTSQNNAGVVEEFPVGSTGCTELPLRPEVGAPSGVGVDPNNDNLVVLDNVYCAGGQEGRITVYRRPYGSKNERVRNLHANCPGQFRFDSTANGILFGDTNPDLRARRHRRVCLAYSCIDQRTFPDAGHNRIYTGGFPGGFTTIPNTLPN
ncbi:MAG TPA: hypothetical protein VGG51_00930 [Candidatus Cybelea sp.]|jgi:hypothetical protein